MGNAVSMTDAEWRTLARNIPMPGGGAAMDEGEWLSCTQARPMLRYLLGTDRPRVQDVEAFPDARTTDRRFRLFACACHDRLRDRLPLFLTSAVAEVAVRMTDGEATEREMARLTHDLRRVIDALEVPWRASRGAEREALTPVYNSLALGWQLLLPSAPKGAWYAAGNASHAADDFAPLNGPEGRAGASRVAEERAQADLLRDIVGNPFRTTTADPRWRTANVVDLARTIYDGRLFDRLPVLADALMDVGCCDAYILDHCRSGLTHVRGCWVVDLVLGKS